jgi:predicted KAP-like P-loop ATPase
METAKTQSEKLRQEAEEVLENMDSGDWQFWKQEYAEAGNDISENAHTAQEKEEMFIQEYIEANWVNE